MVPYIDLIWIVIGRIANAIVSIASLRIMTSIFEPKDFGFYTLLIALQGFCGLILISPVGLHINRHTHEWWDEGTLLKRLSGFNYYLILLSLAMTIVVAIWWLIYPGSDHSINGALMSAFAVSAMVYLGAWNSTLVPMLNMLGFRSGSVGWMLSSSIIGLLLSSVLAYEYRTAMSWMIGQAVGLAIGAIGARLMLGNYHAKYSKNSKYLENMPSLMDRNIVLTYYLPLATATGLMWMQNTGYRFWVGSAWGVAELGMLAIGLSISAQIWSIIETLSMQFLNPYLFRHITSEKSNKQKKQILSDMVNVLWPIYAILAAFNITFASALLKVLTNEKYHEAVIFVLLGVLIEFFRCTSNLWSYAAQIEKRPAQYIIPNGLGVLIVWLGAAGITYIRSDIEIMAVVLVISSMVLCLSMVWIMQKILPVKIDFYRWVIGVVILMLSLVFATVAPINVGGLTMNIISLSIGLVVTAFLMLTLSWRNPALKRMISIQLKKV